MNTRKRADSATAETEITKAQAQVAAAHLALRVTLDQIEDAVAALRVELRAAYPSWETLLRTTAVGTLAAQADVQRLTLVAALDALEKARQPA